MEYSCYAIQYLFDCYYIPLYHVAINIVYFNFLIFNEHQNTELHFSQKVRKIQMEPLFSQPTIYIA